jgi:hypothetical protein
MQISGVSFALTWPCRLCLLRVLLCWSLCYKLSPFQAHWGRWHCTSLLWPVFVYSSRGKWVFPPSCGVFLRQPGLFIYSSGKDFLPPIFGAPPSFPRVFIVLIACYSVSLFSLGGDWSVQGAMLIWLRVVCGSTVVLLSSPCLHLPKLSGHG